MTHFGTIKSYDSGKGSGMIAPEKGGDALMFGKDDFQKQAAAPEQGQRWGYETRQVDGGKPSAINLRRQDQEKQSAKGETAAQSQ